MTVFKYNLWCIIMQQKMILISKSIETVFFTLQVEVLMQPE